MSPSPLADDRTPVPADAATAPERYRAFLDQVPLDERDLDGRALDVTVATLGATDHGDRRVVVVTHAFVIGWFVRHALDAPPWRWLGLDHANGALTTISYDNADVRLVAFNDRGHLVPEGRTSSR